MRGLSYLIDDLRKVFYYIQGNIRYKIYYSKYKTKLIRKHILEQIDYRIRVMNVDCYTDGVCHLCGCTTTALQMCDKSCIECYPHMLHKYDWKDKTAVYIEGNTRVWLWNFNKRKYFIFDRDKTGAYNPSSL